MTNRHCKKKLPLLLIGSILIISACSSTSPKKTIANKTDETTRVTIEKGKFDAPPALQQSTTLQPVVEPVKPVAQPIQNAGQAPKAPITRILPKERSVNIRTAPSAKSRIAAVLKGGQPIEVLETQGNWLKIKWQNGDTIKQGWLKQRFVEGREQTQ